MRSLAPRLGLLIGLLLLCGVVSCNGVNPDDILGTWSMTESSRRYLPTEVGNLAPSLTLSPGGTFTAVEYPRPGIRGAAWAAYSGRGTWSTQKFAAGAGDVYLRFDDNVGDQLWISNFPFSPTLLYFSVGDPDSGHRIQFTRTP
jgi:hypothetical protein